MKQNNKKNKTRNADYSNLKCPYCGAKVELRSSKGIYKADMQGEQMLYVCTNYPVCDAYVRCHEGTTIPLGELANGNLRYLRRRAHYWFDKLYENNDRMSREDAYAWLAVLTCKSRKDAHIGCFNEHYCELVIKKSKEILDFRDKNKISK